MEAGIPIWSRILYHSFTEVRVSKPISSKPFQSINNSPEMHGIPRKAPTQEERDDSSLKAAKLRHLQSQLLHFHHNKMFLSFPFRCSFPTRFTVNWILIDFSLCLIFTADTRKRRLKSVPSCWNLIPNITPLGITASSRFSTFSIDTTRINLIPSRPNQFSMMNWYLWVCACFLSIDFSWLSELEVIQLMELWFSLNLDPKCLNLKFCISLK